ncbi:hypothetical protein F5880DRAFT_1639719 [Lentinula raphanica]|nr:hypothetical protein F5880DRAFT_1639719 [Lentinula raphanica]
MTEYNNLDLDQLNALKRAQVTGSDEPQANLPQDKEIPRNPATANASHADLLRDKETPRNATAANARVDPEPSVQSVQKAWPPPPDLCLISKPTALKPWALLKKIQRPHGEAGDAKNGFNLRDAVELSDDGDKFNQFLSFTRVNAQRAGVDLKRTFRDQDPDVISLTAQDDDYFSKERFPGYWPTREALKQYIKNQRKQKKNVIIHAPRQPIQKPRSRFMNPPAIYISDGEGNHTFEDPSNEEDLVGLGGSSGPAIAGPSSVRR